MFVKIPHTYSNKDASETNPFEFIPGFYEGYKILVCRFSYQGKEYGFYEVISPDQYKHQLFDTLRHMMYKKHDIIESVNILNLHYMEAFGTTYEPSKKPLKDYWLDDSE